MFRKLNVFRTVLVMVVSLFILGQAMPVAAAPSMEAQRSKTSNLPSSGTYDDKQAGWTYSGAWSDTANLSAYAGGYHESSTIGNSASFSFEGSKFTLLYATYRTYGTLGIYVDNILVGTLNQYNLAAKWQQKYISPVFVNGVHIVQFVHASGKSVNVDAIQIYGAPDIDPPAAILDLTALPGTSNGSVNLAWSAPAEDSSTGTGTVSSYLVRYSQSPINAANWDSATPVTSDISEPEYDDLPQMTVRALAPGLRYYFAVRALDEASNLGDMSNPVAVTATSPEPLAAGKYDDKDANWVLYGAWTNYAFPAAYSSSLRTSSEINNVAALFFTGSNFSLGYATGTLYGGLDVYVDGVFVTTINQKALTSAMKTYSLPAPLAAGWHTVQFVHSSGTRVNIDSLTIVPGNDE